LGHSVHVAPPVRFDRKLGNVVAVEVRLTESGCVGAQSSVDEQLDPVARKHLAVGGPGRREAAVVFASCVVERRVEDADRKPTLIGQLAERAPRTVLARVGAGHAVS